MSDIGDASLGLREGEWDFRGSTVRQKGHCSAASRSRQREGRHHGAGVPDKGCCLGGSGGGQSRAIPRAGAPCRSVGGGYQRGAEYQRPRVRRRCAADARCAFSTLPCRRPDWFGICRAPVIAKCKSIPAVGVAPGRGSPTHGSPSRRRLHVAPKPQGRVNKHASGPNPSAGRLGRMQKQRLFT